MKKSLPILLCVLLSLSLLAGCVNPSPGPPEATSQTGGPLKVYTSFYPMYDFASKIGGDTIQLTNLVSAGGEPHAWEPSTSDIIGLETADVFLYNGAGMEHWVSDVLAALENPSLLSAEVSQGIPLLEGHSHDHDDDHDHDHDDDHGHDHDHDHDHDDDHDHDHASSPDPHVWLNPANAKIQMRNIADAFSKADPSNQSSYQANYEQYAAELDKLDQEFKTTLSSLPNKDIVVSHEAFGYLCDAYGLNQVGVEGLSPDSEPDPARMAEIISFVQENNVQTIFFEELVSSRIADVIADSTGAKTAVLSPLEGLTAKQQEEGDDYFSIMRQNLAALKEALQ
ncbi:MAG: metal ABC transporter substrate-binding protein [Christensenellales bacterium]|jgi:zinc transport system substrate-binding protein